MPSSKSQDVQVSYKEKEVEDPHILASDHHGLVQPAPGQASEQDLSTSEAESGLREGFP